MTVDEIPGGPLSEDENRKIRRIIRDEDRMRWLWATLRVWAGYLTGGAITLFALYEGALRLLGKK